MTINFSQAQGIEPLPSLLDLGALPNGTRNLIWTYINQYMKRDVDVHDYELIRDRPWYLITFYLHIWFFKLPGDEYDNRISKQRESLKSYIQNAPYNKVFDLLQCIFEHKSCPEDLAEGINRVFEREQIPYAVVDKNTIIPVVSDNEGVAYLTALHEAKENFSGARTHLKNAGQEMVKENWAGSVRESIHAVESTMKVMVGDESADFQRAIAKLAAKMEFHGALKIAFEKLYAYTNDEKGIRHSLLDQNAKVDKNDAIFMLSSCSAFVTFLIRKAQEVSISLSA